MDFSDIHSQFLMLQSPLDKEVAYAVPNHCHRVYFTASVSTGFSSLDTPPDWRVCDCVHRRYWHVVADGSRSEDSDKVDIEACDIPKAGVFAVRQAPILWRNLQSYLNGQPLVDFRPQSGFLRIISCGDGTAVMDYKGFASHSSFAWSLKNWIDRGWVRKFQIR